MSTNSVIPGLKDDELKSKVVKNVETINNLKLDAKTYAKGVRDTVKELEAENAECIQELENRKPVKK